MLPFVTEATKEIAGKFRAIQTDPNTYKGAQVMPLRNQYTRELVFDYVNARGGVTQQHVLATDPKAVPTNQFTARSYSPGFYKEFMLFTEDQILFLRDLGKNDQSGRGIAEYMSDNAITLNNRIEALIENLRWTSIFQGNWTYLNRVVDFGVPAMNRVAPTVPWGTMTNGAYTANPSATPLTDLRYWLTGGYTTFRKYTSRLKRIWMNPNTARLVLESPEVQTFLQYRFASDLYQSYDISQILSFAIPSLPAVEVYDGWWQQETISPVDGSITVGDAQYFIPDGAVYFETSLPDNNTVGNFISTISLHNGGMDNPQPGKFLQPDLEHLNSMNPRISYLAGIYGGPMIGRPEDLLTAIVV